MSNFQSSDVSVGRRSSTSIPPSLVELLREKAREHPQKIVHTFLPDGEHEGPACSFAGLDKSARNIAANLQQDFKEGERALILFPPGLEFIDAFFGCLYSGLIAVPAFPPNPAQREQTLTRLQALAFDARASLVLTTRAIQSFLQPAAENYPPLNKIRWIAVDSLPGDGFSSWKEFLPAPDHLAYFQYTSGSTRIPHGVCLTHRNLIHNSTRIGEFFQLSADDVLVSWLPMYHNLGLIGTVLQPFIFGMRSYLLSPQTFLENPLLWLKGITCYRGTVCGGPNFAFDLCVLRIPPEKRQGLDLSSWVVAYNGAEAVQPATLKRFSSAFTPYGFSPTAFYPCYGLAEATLMVTGGKRGTGPTILRVDPAALESNRAVIVQDDSQPGTSVVSNGRVFPDQELLIVDPERRVPLTEGQVGEIWIKGPSVSPGYWNHPDETEETFHNALPSGGPYLRTGDLGFLHNQECYITGRIKELIIIRGRNLYPQDIEQTIFPCHPALIPNGAAAFSIQAEGTEKLAIVQEIDPHKASVLIQASNLQEIVNAMRQAVTAAYNVQLYAVALVEPSAIPRTISGKIQRRLTCKLFLEGSLKSLYMHIIGPEPATAPQPVESSQPGADNLLRSALIALGPEKSRGLLENFIRGRISQVLRVPESAIDPNQPLATLGLDSITTIELVENMESALGIKISMANSASGADIAHGAIALDATLADLSQQVANQFAGKSTSPAEKPAAQDSALAAPDAANATSGAAKPSEAKHIATKDEPQPAAVDSPLSYGQRALWFVQRLRPDDIGHNLVYAISLHSPLDAPAFRRGIEKLVLRHPALRTCFIEIDGQPVQRVYPDCEHFALSVDDATTWTLAQLEERLEAEVYTPFNLETGPLMRLSLFVKGQHEFIIVLALHHIIADLWSMAMLGYEIVEFYAAEVQQRDPILKPVRGTFADAVRQESEMLSGPQGEKLLAYWKGRLIVTNGGPGAVNGGPGVPPALVLPTDHPRPPVLTGRATSFSMNLDPDLVAALKSLADEHNTNLFTVLLAAFYTLGFRYTGQTDFLLATPKAMRGRQNANTVGYFINPVVLRASLNETMRFSELLDTISQEIQADFQNDALPFPLLVERVQPSRSLGGNPLFQVFFSWQKTHRMMDSRLINGLTMNEAAGPFDMSGIPVSTVPMKARVTATDLALLLAESEMDARLTVEYSTDIFEAETVRRMLGHLTMLLTSAVRDPNQPIAQMELLTEVERCQLLGEWNPAPPPPVPETAFVPVHVSILRQAAVYPDSPAVEAASRPGHLSLPRCLTYQELAARVHTLSARLSAAGAGQGKIVGLCAERSLEMVAGLLAILKTGSAYLPLDPDYPLERLAFMLSDSNAAVILTQPDLVERLPQTNNPVVFLDQEERGNATQSDPAEDLDLTRPDDPAYIMYTSGSTGQPKGVLVPHSAIAKHCRFMQTYYQITPQDRVLQFASLNFDASLEQIFTTLMSGATLVLRDNHLWDPGEFSRKIADLALSVVNVPPAYWNQWTASDTTASRAEGSSAPASNLQLRLVIVGGDVLSPETLQDWHRLHTGAVRLINAYGPTEATITATTYEVPRELHDHQYQPVQKRTNVPIGRPLAGRTAYILDARQQPVPTGIPGELYIGGECLALGYWNRPDLTREKFIDDPFHPSDNTAQKAHLYRTGDLARFLPDGNIEFLGRVDRQIKILGMRIEPGEIEAALKQHPEIHDAIVLYTPGPTARLVACVSLHRDPNRAQPKTPDLAGFLARRLPQYMIPADFIILDDLPHTPSGKLDQSALTRAILESKAMPVEGYVAPRNDIETYLAGLWANVLCLEKVGVHDNFFALGGHSLLAAQIMARVRSRYNVDIPLRELFETPTVENLAGAIVQALANQEDDEELNQLLNEIEDL